MADAAEIAWERDWRDAGWTKAEELHWHKRGYITGYRAGVAASPSGLEPVTGQSELQPGDVVYVEAVISAEMTLSGERPNGYRIGNHSWHRLDRGQRVFRLAALRTTKEGEDAS